MKAITICQPYAHLISTGAKRVENRTWPTRYRGQILIHAGKSQKMLHGDDSTGMTFGAFVALARIIDCVHIDRIERGEVDEQYPWLADHAHAHGPWCLILSDVSPLSEPIQAKGALGLWNADVKLVAEIVRGRE